jgi:hypothetical protein
MLLSSPNTWSGHSFGACEYRGQACTRKRGRRGGIYQLHGRGFSAALEGRRSRDVFFARLMDEKPE